MKVKVEPKDWLEYDFHCSSLGRFASSFIKLRTEPALTEAQQKDFDFLSNKKRTEKQEVKYQELLDKIKYKKLADSKIELTEQTKKYLQTLYYKEVEGIDTFYGSEATERGNRDEQASIDLVNQALGLNLKKNEKTFSFFRIKGTPDILFFKEDNRSIFDIKTCETKGIFEEKNLGDACSHKYQLLGYKVLVEAFLTEMFKKKYPKLKITKEIYQKHIEVKETGIFFTLPSYPVQYIEKLYNRKLKFLDPDYTTQEDIDNLKKQVFFNHNFDRFTLESRVKYFRVETPNIEAKALFDYAEQASFYLNQIQENRLQFYV